MRLQECYQELLRDSWEPAFQQKRTLRRAVEHATALPAVLGRHTISGSLCALGRQFKDWSADYRLFSRSPWKAESLFNGIITDFVKRHPRGPIPVALDDTAIPKTGKKIQTAFWQYDAMSPPFRANLVYGLRFITAALLFPHYRKGSFSARAFPIRFHQSPVVKKPGKRATPEQQAQYKEEKKRRNLSTQALEVFDSIRHSLDQAGASLRRCLIAVDNSYCNQTIFKALLDRIDIVARCRKDARLCFPAAEDSRRWYDPNKFTPEQVRQDERIEWQTIRLFYGARKRTLRFKELTNVLWQRGAGRRSLRVIVLAPTSYRTSKNARPLYRQPAYLLTTDLESSARLLIQTYVDRWQIEVSHRDLKQFAGIGQAQVWNPLSVPRQPSFTASAYSFMLLASLHCFGPGRPSDFSTLPKWRRQAKRASFLDILTLLRHQIHETSNSSLTHTTNQQTSPSGAFT